jgi:hypothetical protein
MALAFKTAKVLYGGSGFEPAHPMGGQVEFASKVHKAEVAIRSFHIGYDGHDVDHHFHSQRIAIEDVKILNGLETSLVTFNIFMKIKDATQDRNDYVGEIEVLVIADVD